MHCTLCALAQTSSCAGKPVAMGLCQCMQSFVLSQESHNISSSILCRAPTMLQEYMLHISDGSFAGALFFLLGFLAIALQADYPFLCAFAGMSGDYRKAAEALSSITAWHSGTLMKFWALAWLTVPLIVFTVVFWFARAVRVRRLRRAHITRMLCNLNWVVSCTRFKGGSQGDGTSGANDVALLGKGFSRESVAWTLGAATSNQLSDKKPEHIIKVCFRWQHHSRYR